MSVGEGVRCRFQRGYKRGRYGTAYAEEKEEKDEARPSVVETIMHWNWSAAGHMGQRRSKEERFCGKTRVWRDEVKTVELKEVSSSSQGS